MTSSCGCFQEKLCRGAGLVQRTAWRLWSHQFGKHLFHELCSAGLCTNKHTLRGWAEHQRSLLLMPLLKVASSDTLFVTCCARHALIPFSHSIRTIHRSSSVANTLRFRLRILTSFGHIRNDEWLLNYKLSELLNYKLWANVETVQVWFHGRISTDLYLFEWFLFLLYWPAPPSLMLMFFWDKSASYPHPPISVVVAVSSWSTS